MGLCFCVEPIRSGSSPSRRGGFCHPDVGEQSLGCRGDVVTGLEDLLAIHKPSDPVRLPFDREMVGAVCCIKPEVDPVLRHSPVFPSCNLSGGRVFSEDLPIYLIMLGAVGGTGVKKKARDQTIATGGRENGLITPVVRRFLPADRSAAKTVLAALRRQN